MGRLLIILLVMLLPLRGWSAERMASQMAQSQVTTVAMPADCPMLAQPVAEAGKSSSPAKSHAGCQTCQLCMSLAAQNFSPAPLLAYERQAPPVSVHVSIISADLARQAKPPIL